MSNIIEFKRNERRFINQKPISPVELVTNILTPQEVDIKSLIKETKKILREKGLKFSTSHQDLEHLKGNNLILFSKKKCGFILTTKLACSTNSSWEIYSISIDKTTKALDIVNKIISRLGDNVHGSSREEAIS
uniref:hypothetical protein n=1 Tax=Acinetobacter calcoaceticus TaxID=471 RepID=UPI00148AAB0B|nr:hypothetical protein [Acinetobacter calcoaceticus]